MRKVISFIVILPFLVPVGIILAVGYCAEALIGFLDNRFKDLGWFQ